MSSPDAKVELADDQEGTHPPDREQHREEVARMSTLTAPASAREALDMVRAGLVYLAAADPTTLPTETQADCLRELEHDDAILTAAQASVLAGFTAAQGYSADADYSPRTWLMHKTGITRGAAAQHTAWAQRSVEHRLVLAAMAAGEVSESYGR
jgi:hypothetical protein